MEKLMSNIIKTQNLTKKFGSLTAVDNLSLAVPDGSIFAFLGPNGAGKTTTIKLLLNLIAPDSGASEIFSVKSGVLGPAEFSQIGYVSENQ